MIKMVRHVNLAYIMNISMAIKKSIKHYFIFWFYKKVEKKKWLSKKVWIYLDYYWAFYDFLKLLNIYFIII